jgi:hypothetical protein
LFDAFELQDHFALDDHIQPVAAIQLETLVRNGQRDLALKGHFAETQLMAKTLYVGRLQQPRPEFPMYLRSRRQNLPGQFLVNQHGNFFPFSSSVCSVPPW